MQLQCNPDGTWPAYAWPGGYPLYYYTYSLILCPDCANNQNGSKADVNNKRAKWGLIGCDVNWEIPDLVCTHCKKVIEHAYD